jgi:hypothetical protein
MTALSLYMMWRGAFGQDDNDRRLSWSTFDGRGASPQWSRPVLLADRASLCDPALAVFQDKVFAAWRGVGDDQRLFWATLVLREGMPQWSQQFPLDDRGSFSGPALASFQNKLHMAWRGVETDHRLFWATFDGQSDNPQWSSQCVLDNGGSSSGPALAVFRDKLYLAWRGVNDDRTLYWATFDGSAPTLPCAQQWSLPHRKDDRASEAGPALVIFRDQLLMFWRGVETNTSSDQRLFFATFDGQPDWSGQKLVGPLRSCRKPALATFRNKLYIADIGTLSEPPGGKGGGSPEPGPGEIIEAGLVYTTFDGDNPETPRLPMLEVGGTSLASPAMAVFPEVTNSLRLFLSRHGFDPSKGTKQAGGGSLRDLMGLV